MFIVPAGQSNQVKQLNATYSFSTGPNPAECEVFFFASNNTGYGTWSGGGIQQGSFLTMTGPGVFLDRLHFKRQTVSITGSGTLYSIYGWTDNTWVSQVAPATTPDRLDFRARATTGTYTVVVDVFISTDGGATVATQSRITLTDVA